jgi:polyhydroxybutyrate depolymerase
MSKSAAAGLLCVVVGLACTSNGGDNTSGTSSSSSSSSSSGGAGDAGVDGGATASGGCGQPAAASGLLDQAVMVGGVARRYQLFVPTAYDPAVPTRLIFVFHGLGGDGTQIRSYFGFEAQAAGQALFVYPDGLPRQGGRTAWDVEDLLFFDAMLAEISSTYCVDTARVFATGHSFGGYMTNQVGCERGEVVRAIAPVSGGILGGACGGPVAAWIAHGDNDDTVPQSQGITARDHWLVANACGTTSSPTTPAPCVSYEGCSEGNPTVWCSFAGGHYPLPAFIKQGIWDFFAAF